MEEWARGVRWNSPRCSLPRRRVGTIEWRISCLRTHPPADRVDGVQASRATMIQKTSPQPARLQSSRKIRQRLRWLLRQFYGRLVREPTPAKLLQTIDSDGNRK